MFKASDVKDLREKTGAGMLDCKKALEANDGNIEKAIDWLREKGISKAAKKESRIAAEGICSVKTAGNELVMVEVNSETDFVAKNVEFTSFVDNLTTTILNSNSSTIDEALKLSMNGVSVSDAIIALTAKIGEKISFRRFVRLSKTDNDTFGYYLHMGGKIASSVVVSNVDATVSKDVAMHVAAMAPVCIEQKDVPNEMLERERNVIKEQVLNEGKPEAIAEKMVEGRIHKFYKEICLVEQPFIKDSSLTVGQYVKNNNGVVKEIVRFVVGEGIEKRQEVFASEVMNQIKG